MPCFRIFDFIIVDRDIFLCTSFSTSPSTEWQDEVVSTLSRTFPSRKSSRQNSIPTHKMRPSRNGDANPEGDEPKRQRRRLEGDACDREISPSGASSTRSPIFSVSPSSSPVLSRTGEGSVGARSVVDSGDTDGEEDVADAFGQLSLNEDRQIRFHGKASGLHLLGINARTELRNAGGIWRFPKARVWPPLPPSSRDTSTSRATPKDPMSATSYPLPSLDNSMEMELPDPSVQEHLLELYFTYVHASFPILHKGAFWEAYRCMHKKDTPPPATEVGEHEDSRTSQSPLNQHLQHVSPLLLLTMFAIAARYSSMSPLPSRQSESPSPHPLSSTPMWTAGDNYLSQAKTLLDCAYDSSRPCTVQALLLLGYRELGIGAMAQAWMYTGMAVRMAQDLGMHRAADGWVRVGVGRLFSDYELQERRRIWWGCVMLDVYVSTYIGRPLAIVGKDYNTNFPNTDESDEMEPWVTHTSLPPDINGHGYRSGIETTVPVTGHIVSCFIASAKLSTILARIIQSIYSVDTVSSRHADAVHLESALDKWHLDLPEYLRFELRYDSKGNWKVPAGKSTPLPHALTLHMQYWCTTLLLHRPFIRQVYLGSKKKMDSASDEGRLASEKDYELCVKAANHIASIVSFYCERYCLQRAPMFLCFYVFTAGIMHITSLSICLDDPQAQLGLSRCMEALEDMEIVWPSAARALELLRECNPLSRSNDHSRPRPPHTLTNHKRSAEHLAETDGNNYERSPSAHVLTHLRGKNPIVPSQAPYAQAWRSAQYAAASEEASTAHPQDEFPQAGTMSSGHPSSFFPWTGDGTGASFVPYPGTLSTSVLPQTYSTGLMDDRREPQSVTPSSHHGQPRLSGHSNEGEQGYGHVGGGRYPPYWSEYSSFGQMGMVYTHQEGRHPTQAPHPPQVEMYLNEQYGAIYDNHPPS
ncbi:fungal-specific transcription factor domain-containing protein [Scleroderma citrinum]